MTALPEQLPEPHDSFPVLDEGAPVPITPAFLEGAERSLAALLVFAWDELL